MKVFAVAVFLAAALASGTEARTAGGRNRWATPRIVGGEEVAKGTFPELVSVQRKSFGHTCGGSILDANTILTAAHCLDSGVNQYRIVAGEYDLNSEDGDEQVRDATAKIVNEDYQNLGRFDNDIGLLKFEEPLDLSGLATINLPPASYLNQLSGNSYAAGWGNDQEPGDNEDITHAVTLPLVDDETCTDAYGSSMMGDVMICAGITGKDSCQGDSGGPLFWDDEDGTRLQIGITSWGRGCGEPGFPGVYAETAALLDWVEQNR